MSLVVGSHERSEIVTDPAEAWRRGRPLDAMLAAALPPRPRGVMRASHAGLNRMDDERMLMAARRLNGPPMPG